MYVKTHKTGVMELNLCFCYDGKGFSDLHPPLVASHNPYQQLFTIE